MDYLSLFMYIVISGYINRIRGIDVISRAGFIVFHGVFSYMIFRDPLLSVLIGIGILHWLHRTWGKYFIAFDANAAKYKEREGVKLIGNIVDKFYGNPLYKKNIPLALRNWGTIAMSLRGFIYALPLFASLAFYLENWKIMLLSPVMLVQGLYYRGIEKYRFDYAEVLTGGTIATLITISTLI